MLCLPFTLSEVATPSAAGAGGSFLPLLDGTVLPVVTESYRKENKTEKVETFLTDGTAGLTVLLSMSLPGVYLYDVSPLPDSLVDAVVSSCLICSVLLHQQQTHIFTCNYTYTAVHTKAHTYLTHM